MSNDVVPNYAIGAKIRPGVSKVIEEAGELLEVFGKLQATLDGSGQHWTGELDPRVLEEVADLMAALGYFASHAFNEDEQVAVEGRIQAKRALFDQWHAEERAKVLTQWHADRDLLWALCLRSDTASARAFDRLRELTGIDIREEPVL